MVDDDVVIEGNDESNVAGGGNGEEGVKKKIDIFESALAAVEENTDVEVKQNFSLSTSLRPFLIIIFPIQVFKLGTF